MNLYLMFVHLCPLNIIYIIDDACADGYYW